MPNHNRSAVARALPVLPPLSASAAAACGLLLAAGSVARAALPPVPVPAENPITEPKRLLGKALFWDEQLSTSNIVSCGSCHQPSAAGMDPRPRARHPGLDGLLNSPDDTFGSPGVSRADAANDYIADLFFGTNPQVTDRAANSMINAAYATDLFWDGRARSRFTDPQTGETVIPAGGALESQAVGPPLSDVEMAHENLDWPALTAKLARSRPLDLAADLPADVAAALESNPTYPDLFAQAFGDGEITAQRIAFALATYQRTLIADDTPWDRFTAGDAAAMTPQQVQGWNTFRTSECAICHAPPLFTDNTFRNIGLRPLAQDPGRQNVTGLAPDRGRFKTPGLRNVGLKPTLMHTGQFTAINQVFPFYAGPGAPGNNNRDPILPSAIPGPQQAAVLDFLANALTDARVRDEVFPFDRPTLFAQRPDLRPVPIPAAIGGTGGFQPLMLPLSPAMIGSTDFRLGLSQALGGARATLHLSTQPPVAGVVAADLFAGEAFASGIGAGVGVATLHIPLTPDTFAAEVLTPGATLFAQWFVEDPAAPSGVARSDAFRISLFCPRSGCATDCPADFNHDGTPNVFDLFDFLAALDAGLDYDNDQAPSTIFDLFDFLADLDAGCP